MSGPRTARLIRLLPMVAVLLLPAIAHAHTSLVRSSPAARAILEMPPSRVELWFAERLEAAYSSMSVWSASGSRLDKQDVVVGPDDPKRLSVGVFTLRPGAYTVRYRVLSVDGHVLESSFVFTVGLRPPQ
ncbi:MAG: copper resistance protein CopC [Candidatus Rokubacteria bacterium]|nr:copper resistance protein CopC [Candidatus Rokubacteria bacterium]